MSDKPTSVGTDCTEEGALEALQADANRLRWNMVRLLDEVAVRTVCPACHEQIWNTAGKDGVPIEWYDKEGDLHPWHM